MILFYRVSLVFNEYLWITTVMLVVVLVFVLGLLAMRITVIRRGNFI